MKTQNLASRGARCVSMLAMFGLLSAKAIAAEAVFNPDNGNWYAAIEGAITWEQAKPSAESLSVMGVPGHLATITSPAEQNFLVNNLPVARVGYLLGGAQAPGQTGSAAGWFWATGEAWSYINWPSFEPNDFGGAEENALATHCCIGENLLGFWNDVQATGSAPGYVCEFETGSLRVVGAQPTCGRGWVLEFNHPVERTGDYMFFPDLNILNVLPGDSPYKIFLNTDPPAPNTTYTLTINGEVALNGRRPIPDPFTIQIRSDYGRFAADFNSGQLPPGTAAFGSTYIGGDGILHLNDASSLNTYGAFAIPDQTGGFNLERLKVAWRSYFGGSVSGLGAADGYSFSWATDLPNPPTYGIPSEEGWNTGLSVSVDTFDNGTAIDPEGTSLQINWNGSRIASIHVPNNDPGNGPYLRKDDFVEASVEVTPAGVVTFKYDATTLTGTIPVWTGIEGGSFLFASRTGAGSENHWIDDIQINDFTLGPPTTTGPNDVTAKDGTQVRFTVNDDGTFPRAYQWQVNGVPIPGATQRTYTFSTELADNGTQYRVIVSNECGTTASREAVLTVTSDPTTAADIGAQKSAEPSLVAVGKEIVYQVKVINHGPDDATWVFVKDQLPPNIRFVSADSASGTCTYDPELRRVTCLLGNLPKDATAEVTIVATAISTGDAVVNTAVAFGDQPDPNSANQLGEATVKIVADVAALTTEFAKMVEQVGQVTGFSIKPLTSSFSKWPRILNDPNSRNDIAVAKGGFGAFINKVQAQAGKKIPQAQADELTKLAGQISAQLGQ